MKHSVRLNPGLDPFNYMCTQIAIIRVNLKPHQTLVPPLKTQMINPGPLRTFKPIQGYVEEAKGKQLH